MSLTDSLLDYPHLSSAVTCSRIIQTAFVCQLTFSPTQLTTTPVPWGHGKCVYLATPKLQEIQATLSSIPIIWHDILLILITWCLQRNTFAWALCELLCFTRERSRYFLLGKSKPKGFRTSPDLKEGSHVIFNSIFSPNSYCLFCSPAFSFFPPLVSGEMARYFCCCCCLFSPQIQDLY